MFKTIILELRRKEEEQEEEGEEEEQEEEETLRKRIRKLKRCIEEKERCIEGTDKRFMKLLRAYNNLPISHTARVVLEAPLELKVGR